MVIGVLAHGRQLEVGDVDLDDHGLDEPGHVVDQGLPAVGPLHGGLGLHALDGGGLLPHPVHGPDLEELGHGVQRGHRQQCVDIIPEKKYVNYYKYGG